MRNDRREPPVYMYQSDIPVQAVWWRGAQSAFAIEQTVAAVRYNQSVTILGTGCRRASKEARTEGGREARRLEGTIL